MASAQSAIKRIDRIVLVNLALSAATAFSGILASVYGCGQLSEMANQTKLSAQAISQTGETLDLMRQEQRPWVAITHIELAEPLQVGRKILPLFRYKNTGSHPGQVNWLLAASANIFEGNDIGRIIEDYESQSPLEDVSMLVAPDTEMVQTMGLALVNQEWLDLVNSGRIKLVIIGKFKYTDPADPGSDYETTFLYEYVPTGDGLAQFLHRGEYSHMK